MDFNRFIRQPTTIHALGVIAAGVGASLAEVTTGNHTLDVAIAIASYVLVHLGIDDHSVMETNASAFTADLIHGAAPAKTFADAVTLGGAVQAAGMAPILTPNNGASV